MDGKRAKGGKEVKEMGRKMGKGRIGKGGETDRRIVKRMVPEGHTHAERRCAADVAGILGDK